MHLYDEFALIKYADANSAVSFLRTIVVEWANW